MIKLRHKQTGKEWNYSATVWFSKGYDINDYDILEWSDVVELFYDKAKKISDGKMAKSTAEKKINEAPYIGYWYEDVPRPVPIAIRNPGQILSDAISDNANEVFEHLRNQLPNEVLSNTNTPLTAPVIKQTQPQTKKIGTGTVVFKMFKWTANKTLFIIMWIFIGISGTVVGGLLLICILNYCKHKGFHL
jgi:hypothetical protein